MAKRFSHQMSKTFHIFKWISFAISIFVIVEETPSVKVHFFKKVAAFLIFISMSLVAHLEDWLMCQSWNFEF